ncbi:phenylacetate-CoA ligase [Leifsonia sp. 563]|uniref:phenylacetate--CoA ligase family protein n=1 Tax=Leifsonia sp. 563 TaxID=3156412 RepID=UPI0033933BE9
MRRATDGMMLGFARWTHHTALRNQRGFERLITSGRAAALASRLSRVGAEQQMERARRDVPAYRDFLETHSIAASSCLLTSAPETDKRSYIDPYSTAERCRGGVIPRRDAEIDESSGSSGVPYNWLRGRGELNQLRRTLSRLAIFMYGEDIVTINGFSMGAWATGTNVTMAFANNGLIKSTGPDAQKMLSVFSMLGPDRTYVVTGYPPFLLELLEYGKQQGFDWAPYRLMGIVGGEAMSETLRSRLLEHFDMVSSAYGASDLDIGVASEFPLSTWIRRACAERPDLTQALFGETRRLPMLFQYDPLDYFVERNTSGELVVTVNRPTALSPRLRYNVHDAGGSLDFDEVIRICERHGLNPLEDAPLPFGGRHPRLPFLYVSGRSDSTVSYLGANIYPEDIEQALFADAPIGEKGSLRGYAISMAEGDDGIPHPVVHVELETGGAGPEVTHLQERIITRLAQNSRDFRTALQEDSRAADIEVVVHQRESGPFAEMSKSIKRKYILE